MLFDDAWAEGPQISKMTPEGIIAAIVRAELLEVGFREQARSVELDPHRIAEAAALYRQAEGLRWIRLALVERLGIKNL